MAHIYQVFLIRQMIVGEKRKETGRGV